MPQFIQTNLLEQVDISHLIAQASQRQYAFKELNCKEKVIIYLHPWTTVNFMYAPAMCQASTLLLSSITIKTCVCYYTQEGCSVKKPIELLESSSVRTVYKGVCRT